MLEHPDRLKVLGDGSQRKSYLCVQDCVNAMLHVINLGTAKNAKHRVEIYNLGTDEYVQVNNSVGYICGALGLKPKLEYTGGNRGWVGDNPFIFLDTKKIRATGWKTSLTIEQGIGPHAPMAAAKPVGLRNAQMKIVVLGLWHLGSVTAACVAKHFQVVGLDFDEANVAN